MLARSFDEAGGAHGQVARMGWQGVESVGGNCIGREMD